PTPTMEVGLELDKTWVLSLGFSPDAALLAVGVGEGDLSQDPQGLYSYENHAFELNGEVQLWQVDGAGCFRGTLDCGSAPVFALAISADGKWIATGSKDGKVCVSEMPTLAVLKSRRTWKVTLHILGLIVGLLLFLGYCCVSQGDEGLMFHIIL